jgi:hypothetical protein
MYIFLFIGKVSVTSRGEGHGCSFTIEIDMQRKIIIPNTLSPTRYVYVYIYVCIYVYLFDYVYLCII